MSFIINPFRFAAAVEQNFHQDIADAGLSTGLQFVLDAGSASSYDGSSQKWLDLSGNGQDFFRGADGSATTDDPTFNGSAGGLSSSEYFSLDGGDFFRYDAANTAAMNAMHKNNALWSAAFFVYLSAGGSDRGIFGTNDNSSGSTGVNIRADQGSGQNQIRFRATRGNAPAAANQSTPNSWLTEGAWNFIGVSVDEAGGTGHIWSDTGGDHSFTSTYDTPSSSASDYTLELCSNGNAGSMLNSGSRMGMAAFWDGVELSAANFSTLHAAMGGRYGI